MKCSKGAVLIPALLKFKSGSGVSENLSVNLSVKLSVNLSVNLSVMQRYIVAGER